VELSVVMPCLDEAETVRACVRQAAAFLVTHQIDGEVIVADNGSTDGSPLLARAAGARVIAVPEAGYGNALMGGIMAARGTFVIIGDADGSYDFSALLPLVGCLRDGADLVMGNRFRGGIEPGAMRPLHRYLGNPLLSFAGRLFFASRVGDFHCGLRGFRRDSVRALGLQASGMEFASEMVVKATLAGLRIAEVPTTLARDGRSHPPHLRSWRDGWRHLRFLLLFSPRWLFGIPGLALITLGLAAGIAVTPAPLHLGGVTFDVSTLAAAAAMVIIGFQAVLFALFTHVYATAEGFLPDDARIRRLLATWSLERGLIIGGLLALAGLAGLVGSLVAWNGARSGNLDYRTALRLVVPSVTALVLSCQIILGVFFLSILSIRRTRHRVALQPGNGRRGAGVPRLLPPRQRAPEGPLAGLPGRLEPGLRLVRAAQRPVRLRVRARRWSAASAMACKICQNPHISVW
jgi:Glycosyl transferase family 2